MELLIIALAFIATLVIFFVGACLATALVSFVDLVIKHS
jgi:hypothetical protein